MAKDKKKPKPRTKPPRTIMDAFMLLQEKGDAAIESPVVLALLSKDQLTEVLEMYAKWKARENA
jgi:hypothetical protein